MTHSFWKRSHHFHSPDQTADVVVVGGGFVGLSTAYWLSEFRPDWRIMVIEAETCGSGASGRNAGFLTPGSLAFYQSLSQRLGEKAARSVFELAEESLSLLSKHILVKALSLKLNPAPAYTLIGKNQTDFYKGPLSPESLGFRWLEKSALAHPLNQSQGAWVHENEYSCQPMQLLEAIKTQLLSRKVVIIEQHPVFAIEKSGEHYQIKLDTHQVQASKVAVALNAYTARLLPNYKNKIHPQRAQMMAFELKEPLSFNGLAYQPSDRVYWRLIDEKVLVIGGKRLLDEEGEKSEVESLSPKIQGALEDYVTQELGLHGKVLHRWTGIMGFTSDELPLMEVNEGFCMVGGFSGHGMGWGFKSAMELAELMTDQRSESTWNKIRK